MEGAEGIIEWMGAGSGGYIINFIKEEEFKYS